jgi:hypothetical protein
MRRVYESYADAKAAFDAAAAIAKPLNLGAFEADPEAFADSENTLAAVAVVGSRDRNAAGKMESGIRAVVLFPMPTAAAFVAGAESWIAKIVEKEAAHVAFRNLRNAESMEELAAAAQAMPTDVATYVAEHARGGEGLDTDAFDTVWNPLRKMLKEAMPELVDLLPQKGEVLKAIRSKSYAESEHNALEARGVFIYLGNMLVKAAEGWTDEKGESDPIDATAIKDWLAERDTLEIKKPVATEKDFSVLANLNLGVE